VAAFTPSVFGTAKPRDFETWHCSADRARVEFVKRDWSTKRLFAFERAQFLVDGALPVPAI
ncbi:MAG TPA: hypothetical protein VFV98_16470, partial [Vicinamibacterales bacterium]|nr:hypothetical protein [Vicinamibacterales bacterium]